MIWWFIAAAVVSFIFGFITSSRFSLFRSLSGFSMFWNSFVQFVKENENKTVVLNERFLRIIAASCIDKLKNNPGDFIGGNK